LPKILPPIEVIAGGECNFYTADNLFVHRIVTSELTFYLETLKTLHALPLDELADKTMDEIWTSR